MAEQQDNLERTEEASPKRREEARKKGTVALSRMVVPAATLAAAVLILRFVGAEFFQRLARLFAGFIALAGARHELAGEKLLSLSIESGLLMAPVLAPLFLGVTLAGMGSGLLPTGFLFTAETLRPDFGRLSPLAGAKRLFRPEAAADLAKSLVTPAPLGALAFHFLFDDLAALAALPTLGVEEILLFAGREGTHLTGAAVAIMAGLAGPDHPYQR